jgi:bifunctional non-homologous end joining protein LigD
VSGQTGAGEGQRLARYRRKRDFTRTPEPAGSPPDDPQHSTHDVLPAGSPPGGLRFVVQRHRARRVHYDLRFEIDGVLASWAVPKGPTLDPAVRRAAIHVEDHPIEYFDFEGVIPAGGYGAGDVIVWDTGTWAPHDTDDPAAAVASGELHAEVTGHKLRGRLVLVHTGDGDQWLLLHKKDEFAVSGWDPEDYPRSVLSGRTNEEVKAHPERIWRSDLPPAEASVPASPAIPADPASAGSRQAQAGTRAQAGSRPARAGAEARAGTGAPAGTGAQAGTRAQARPGRRAAQADPAPQGGPAPRGGPVAQARLAVPAGPSAAEMDALAAMGHEGTWEVFGRQLRVTNLDKTLFPARPGGHPVTKREFLRYAARIAPVMLPYLQGRALNLLRYPGGAQAAGFWQKQLPAHAPQWLPRWDNPEASRGKTATYLVADEPAALVWAANFGALEWHAWTSRTDQPHLPSYALIDIDPGTATSWAEVLVLARLHRSALDHLGVRAGVKVTGRHGIQIWVPVIRGPGFEDTRAWVERLSREIGSVVPELVSWEWDVRARGGRARLDYTQNAVNKTLVAPWSTRAGPGAPVSAPIGWAELDDPELRPDTITIDTVPGRLARDGDPFAIVLGAAQELPPVS